jgi:hypothetical protein
MKVSDPVGLGKFEPTSKARLSRNEKKKKNEDTVGDPINLTWRDYLAG